MVANMESRVLHVSEADAVRDVAAILQRVQAGIEVLSNETRNRSPLSVRPLHRAVRSLSASPWQKPTKRKPAEPPCSTRISPPTWRRLSGNGSRGIRQRGVDPGFKCGSRGGTARPYCPADPRSVQTGLWRNRGPSFRGDHRGAHAWYPTRRVTISFEDLLIAATALPLGFGVATGNVRHFEQIPGLKVMNELMLETEPRTNNHERRTPLHSLHTFCTPNIPIGAF